MTIQKTAISANKSYIVAGVYGRTKVGKTWFASSFPNPCFIAVAQERGWSALHKHPNAKNITVLTVPQPRESNDPRPRSAQADMQAVLRYIGENYEQEEWKTIVIDTMSVYIELVISELTEYGKSQMWGNKGGVNRWDQLQQHVANMRDFLQDLPLHVVWLFHVNEVKSGEQIIRQEPKLAGGSLDKYLLPTCNIVAHLTKEESQIIDPSSGKITGAETVRRLWTKCPPDMYPRFEAGTRFEDQLPAACYYPDYATLMKFLGSEIAE